MIETIYGLGKRLEFVAGVISEFGPKRILDVGCGTGANLTALLAQQFPEIEFLGVDSDPTSIAFAVRENRAGNARYLVKSDAADIGTFDLIIASEVIEHVEDPNAFLSSLRSFLVPDGKLLLTLPNGLGPFELVSFVETVMHLTGVYRILRAFKRILQPGISSSVASDTLAVSPHINFFSYRQIRYIISSGGFEILAYRPRTFLCGFGFDHVMRSRRLIAWNAAISDQLPPQMASAWMFLLTPSLSVDSPPYKRSAFANLRRFLNEKRWHLN